MIRKRGLFVSNDRLSEFVYKKLSDTGEVYPFSFSPVDFVRSTVLDFGDIDGVVGHLKKTGAREMVLIGGISASSLFKNDMRASGKEFLSKCGLWRGEKILADLIAHIEKEGIKVLSLTMVMKEELAMEKVYTGGSLDALEQSDMEMGIRVLKDLMKYRAGQSVSVKNGMIVALEGIEGTDEMIRRAGKYCGQRGFVVVKIAGENKDERFDMPVVGPQTAKVLKTAGGKVIAVEAGKTIILDEEKTMKLCNENRIKFLGVKP